MLASNKKNHTNRFDYIWDEVKKDMRSFVADIKDSWMFFSLISKLLSKIKSVK